jgi:hypothetical protein
MNKFILFCLLFHFSFISCDFREVVDWIAAEVTKENVPDFSTAYRCSIPELELDFTGSLSGYTSEIFKSEPDYSNIWMTVDYHGKSYFFPEPHLHLFTWLESREVFFWNG